MRVPPGWTDVHVADDPEARLMVVGRDAAGRTQGLYSAAHTEAALREKFERNRLVSAHMGTIVHNLDVTIAAGGSSAEAASALRVIVHTGARVGSDADTGAKQKAYGVSTLLAEHVKIENGLATLDFPAKGGKRNVYQINDDSVVADLQERVNRAGSPTERLFKTSDAKMRDTLKQLSGQEFKVHDLRTWVATATAQGEVERMPIPTSPAEYWKQWDQVAERAAKQINDTVDVAMTSYVNPIIFEPWRTRAGVSADAKRPAKKR